MTRLTAVHTKIESILNHQVYLVGGAVRDCILGIEPKDYDFCTDLLPDEIESQIRASSYKPYTLGKKFGTIGVKVELEPQGYEYVEITTFRGEEYDQVTKDELAKSRKPTVHFITDLREDLSRRDFTCNALAMDVDGVIIDYFDGQLDLENRILQTVGNPKQRFREDPLRILRALRFAAKYNLTIESKTWDTLCKMRYELVRISRERWVQEMDGILGLENVRVGLDLLMDSGILALMIPELILQKNYDQNSPWHDFTLWDHTCKVVAHCPRGDVNLRWAALLHDIAKPFTRTENPKGNSNYIHHEILGSEMSLKVSHYLKFSSKRRDFIRDIILNHLTLDCALKVHDDASKKLTPNDDTKLSYHPTSL
jgi:tRNA nucleotidyltransferase (CCA-adding enzyme)